MEGKTALGGGHQTKGGRTDSWLPHLQLPYSQDRVSRDLYPHDPHSPGCHSLLPEPFTSAPLITAVPVILISWCLSILNSGHSEVVTRKQIKLAESQACRKTEGWEGGKGKLPIPKDVIRRMGAMR